MNSFARRFLIGVVFVFLGHSSSALAAQRMLIFRGSSLTLGRHASGSLEAFCLDSGKDIPRDLGSVSRLLTPSRSVTVTFANGKPIPLGDAISDGRIRAVPTGDYHGVGFVNTTEESATIEVSSHAVFGGEKDTLDGIDLGHIGGSGGRGDGNNGNNGNISPPPSPDGDVGKHFRLQDQIWHDNALSDVLATKLSTTDYFKNPERPHEILDFDRKGDALYVWCRDSNRDAIEFWEVNNGRRPGGPTSVGVEAIQAWADKSPRAQGIARITTSAEGAQVHFRGQSFNVPTPALTDLINGTGGPEGLRSFFERPEHPHEVIIVPEWESSIPFSPKLEVPTDPPKSAQLVRALQRMVGRGVRFRLGLDPFLAGHNLEHVVPLKRGDGVAVIADKDTFSLTDYGICNRLASGPPNRALRIIPDIADTSTIHESNVVLVAGHKDEALRRAVSYLVSGGSVRKKVVAVMSCYGTGDEAFFSRLLHSPDGPAAFLFYGDPIHPEAVYEVLTRLDKELSAMHEGDSADLPEMLDRAIDAAKGDPNLTPLIQREVEKLHDAVLQLSRSLDTIFGAEHNA